MDGAGESRTPGGGLLLLLPVWAAPDAGLRSIDDL